MKIMKIKELKPVLSILLSVVIVFSVLSTIELKNVNAVENYKVWSQTDSRWSSIKMGGGDTVGRSGCAATAVTKIAIQAGAKQQSSFNVATFVNSMNASGGFTSGGAIYWGTAGKVIGLSDAGFLTTTGNHYLSDYTSRIIDWINQGNHLILNVPTSNGHWVAVDEAKTLSTGQVYIMDNGYEGLMSSKYPYFMYCRAYKGGSTPIINQRPVGQIDSVEVLGAGQIRVKGWSYDPDEPSKSISVHFYVGGETAEAGAEVLGVAANKGRTDVNSVMNVPGNHGFDEVLYTGKSGNTPIYAYGLDSSGANNNSLLNNSGTIVVNIPSDTEKPVVSDVVVSNITSDGYDVTCKVSDNVAVKRVEFPTWTRENGQDDLIWHVGTISNGVAKYHVNRSDHNNEFGVYCTDVYAYDYSEKRSEGKGADRVTLEPVTEASGTLNGHEYIVYKDSLTATEARAKEGNGYHLATITSVEENNFIMNLAKKISIQPEGYWFGANDLKYESHFQWETGEPFIYHPWPDGQPDNNGGLAGDENYFGIWASGIWNDFPESYKLGYVLEKDPPASTASGSYNGHDYYVSAEYLTRDEAKALETDGWYLATISSTEERDYIKELINSLSNKNLEGYWLGGSDVVQEGTFVWENGESFTFDNWDSGEPSNNDGMGHDEDYLVIKNSGKYNDISFAYCAGYILERDPESRIIKVDSINLTSNRNETNDAYEGVTFQLTAEVLPEEATDKTVYWSSSDADYAVVDDTGNVTVNSTLPNTIKTITITATSSDGEVIAEYSFVVCPKSSCQHTWDTGNILSDSTCSKNGEMEYTCTKCGTTKIESIGLKQHTEVIDEAIPATCETEGKTEGSHCSVCGKVLTEQTVIPRLQAPEEDQNNSQDETQKAEQKTGQGDNQKTEQKNSQDDNQKIEHKNSQDNSQKNDDKTGQNTERKTTLDEVQMSTPTADEQISVPTEELQNDNTVSYSNEWVNGVWYDENGNQTYSGTLSWKSNSGGWWVEDSTGWYPVSSWQKIDGEWYYFTSSGYMASGEYYNGYWFNSDGTMSNDYYLNWKSNSTGWWVEDKSGWWPSGSWLKINGGWYYFDSDGYMVTNKKIDGYWIGADGICQ